MLLRIVFMRPWDHEDSLAGSRLRVSRLARCLQALFSKKASRQQCCCDNAAQGHATSQIQDGIDVPFARGTTSIQMLRNQWADDPEQSTPEARDATCRSSDRRWKGLRGPSIQDCVKHGLEEILHNVEADVGSCRVDTTEKKNGRSHQRGRGYHGPFTAYTWCAI